MSQCVTVCSQGPGSSLCSPRNGKVAVFRWRRGLAGAGGLARPGQAGANTGRLSLSLTCSPSQSAPVSPCQAAPASTCCHPAQASPGQAGPGDLVAPDRSGGRVRRELFHPRRERRETERGIIKYNHTNGGPSLPHTGALAWRENNRCLDKITKIFQSIISTFFPNTLIRYISIHFKTILKTLANKNV